MQKSQISRLARGGAVALALGLAAVRATVAQNPNPQPSVTPAPVAVPNPGAPAGGGPATPTPAPAPTPQPIPPELLDDPNLTREERIRRHQLRLQKFITEAEQRAAAQNQQSAETQAKAIADQKAAGPLPAMPPPSAVVMPGPPMASPVPFPGAPPPPGAAPAPPGAQVPFRTSQAILYFEPFQVLARAGDTFETQLLSFNSSGGPFDEIRVALKYDPLVVAPEQVSDASIFPLIEGSSDLQVNRSKGEIRYTAVLRETISKTTATLLTFRWRALNPILYSELGFLTRPGETRIGTAKRNILGFFNGNVRTGGTLPASLVITPRDNSLNKLIPTLSDTALARIDERVELTLEAQTDSVAKGKEWIVSVMLRNDAGLPFNDLRARIFFDPRKLEAVDWHTGNWIREGINIFDGFAHQTYPWDVHLANSADNEKGEILYHVGTQAARYFPGGELARIKFKALANASFDDVRFDYEAPKRAASREPAAPMAQHDDATDVSFLGSSVMFAPRRTATAEERPAPEPLRRPDT